MGRAEVARSRHVALLRGINVGKAKRIAMADLRALVEGLGFTDVRTLLNSGNVVFTATGSTAKSAAARIEKAIAAELGIEARVTVLSAAELDAIVDANPLLDVAKDASRLLVAVPQDPADRAKLLLLQKQLWGRDTLAVGPRAAYVWCAGGILESKLAEAVGRALGSGVTSRNWATMLKIQALTRDET